MGGTVFASATGTLAAGVATEVANIPCDGMRSLRVVINNTGVTNAIGTTLLEYSADGTYFAPDPNVGTAVGSMGASTGAALIEVAELSAKFVRVTLTSTSGSTYAVGYRMAPGEPDGAPSTRVNGTVIGGTAVTGAISASTLTATGLTATRIPVVSTGGLIVDDAGLTYVVGSDALTCAGVVTAAGLTSTAAGTTTVNDATTNASTVAQTLVHTTSGTADANIGAGLLFKAEDAAGTSENAVQLDGILTTATNASEASALVVKTRTGGGALTEAARVGPTGVVTAAAGFVATTGALTGSAALAVEATGALSLGVNASTTSIAIGQAAVPAVFAGDIAALGGFRQTIGPFHATLAADQTATATNYGGLAGAGAWVAPRAGSLTAIGSHLDAAITGATKTAIPGVYKNGTIINAAAILTHTTGGAETDLYLAIAKDTYTFAAGDRIDIRYTSTTITNTPKMWATCEIEC
jgi:hypothetical protein